MEIEAEVFAVGFWRTTKLNESYLTKAKKSRSTENWIKADSLDLAIEVGAWEGKLTRQQFKCSHLQNAIIDYISFLIHWQMV